MADDRWTNVGFSRLRMVIALILLEEGEKRTGIFFSYKQLAGPLNNYLGTNNSDNKMATIDESLINSAFEKPRAASSCLSCRTIFEGRDEFEDFSENYFIHVDKRNLKVAFSKSKDSANFRSVDDNEATLLLRNMVLDPKYNLTFAEQSANGVQHTSLKRLLAACWLNDEVINGINIHYLRQKLDENSHIYHSQFMAKLLQTGEHGTAEPSYDYSQVAGWSGRVGQNGLFGLQNLYIPINHKNIHWLTMRINFTAKMISLWDSQGVKQTNVTYTNAALRYLGDEYAKTYPNQNLLQWLEEWKIGDLSDESPQQANDYDCGIFTLLNLCLLVEEGSISRDSYSQTSIYAKEVRNIIAHILWNASSNRPEV